MLAIKRDGKKKITFTDLLSVACWELRGCPWASQLLPALEAIGFGRARVRSGPTNTGEIIRRRPRN